MQEGVSQEEFGECVLTCLSFYMPIHYLSLCLTVFLSVPMSACLQVFLARQAVRARRRITRRMAKQKLMDTRKLLRKLRLLAKEVSGHDRQCWGVTSYM